MHLEGILDILGYPDFKLFMKQDTTSAGAGNNVCSTNHYLLFTCTPGCPGLHYLLVPIVSANLSSPLYGSTITIDQIPKPISKKH